MKIAFKVNTAFDSRETDNSTILDESIFNLNPANDEILSIKLDSHGNLENTETCALGMKASNEGDWEDGKDGKTCANNAYFLDS